MEKLTEFSTSWKELLKDPTSHKLFDYQQPMNIIEFYKLFLNNKIIKLGFGITNDIGFLTKEIPYVVLEVVNDKEITLIDKWNQLVNNPIEHQLYDYQYKKNNQPIGLSDFVEFNFQYPLDKSLSCSNWSCYPLSKKQEDYAARDSCFLLMAYLKNIFPTDNSFKLQTRQNKFYFY